MSIMSRLMARIARLPPAETYDIGVEKDLAIPIWGIGAACVRRRCASL
jgi:hypothetical protein